jgi:3-oxoacyl-[acyl-carrier protein] reductase
VSDTPGPAFVTGAASGVGRATAMALAADGRGVVVGDLEAPEAVAAEIRDGGGSALAVAADVSVRGQVEAMERAGRDAFGPIDVMVANAAVGFADPFLEIGDERWERVLGVNLRGAVLCAQAVLPSMLERGGGSLVLVSSIAGRRASLALGAHYTCSKYGLIGLTRHLAGELAGSGVRVNCVAPGPVDTPFLTDKSPPEALERIRLSVPLRRLGRPEEVAEAIRWLSSTGAAFVNGAVLDVNGGLY